MGKHHGKVWDHYNKSMVQNVPHAKCKYCKAATYRNHASRMEKHLLKCKFCPAQVKQQFCKVPQQSSAIVTFRSLNYRLWQNLATKLRANQTSKDA